MIGRLFEVVPEVQKADSEHQSTLAIFQEAMQSLQATEKLKIQTLKKIDQGKTRNAELEAELKELKKKMNDIKGKCAALTKVVQIREQSLEKINKKVTKFSCNAKEKKSTMDVATTKVRKG